MGDTKMNTASILGVQFHAVTKQQAVELAMSKICLLYTSQSDARHRVWKKIKLHGTQTHATL